MGLWFESTFTVFVRWLTVTQTSTQHKLGTHFPKQLDKQHNKRVDLVPEDHQSEHTAPSAVGLCAVHEEYSTCKQFLLDVQMILLLSLEALNDKILPLTYKFQFC